jgi:hypothetical protein
MAARVRNTYGLRIKQIYFDAILAGLKRYEYRSVKPCYSGLPNATVLALHYQRPRRMLVDVVQVQVVPTHSVPELAHSDIAFTDTVYRVELANPRLIAP